MKIKIKSKINKTKTNTMSHIYIYIPRSSIELSIPNQHSIILHKHNRH